MTQANTAAKLSGSVPGLNNFIPFNKPSLVGDEFAFMAEAAAMGSLANRGAFSERVEDFLSGKFGAPVMLTKSCTNALEMAMILLDIHAGDEVIVPAFAYLSCANAVALRGAKPVFVDVLPETCNIDPHALEAAITPKTRAILVIHYGGVPCDMATIMRIAGERDIPVIEDAAHCLFGSFRGRRLGTFGRFGTLSFHETKNIHCGEGGALILQNPDDVARAEVVRDKGSDRAQFLRGEVAKYTWADLGSSFGLPNVLAAFLLAQLQRYEAVQAKRRKLWMHYHEALTAFAHENGYARMQSHPATEFSYHLHYLLLRDQSERDRFIHHLSQCNIHAVSHYQPLNRSAFARAIGAGDVACPQAESIAERLVRLPLFHEMTPEQETVVIRAVNDFPH